MTKAAAARGSRRATDAQKIISFRAPGELYDRWLNAIDALSGPPERMRYVSAGRSMLEREVLRLEKKYNRGKPFSHRPTS